MGRHVERRGMRDPFEIPLLFQFNDPMGKRKSNGKEKSALARLFEIAQEGEWSQRARRHTPLHTDRLRNAILRHH